jgi:competence protein ComGC
MNSIKRTLFSITELMVIIAILSLTTSILMPSLKKLQFYTMETGCRSRLSTLGSWVMEFSTDNNDMWPRHCTNDASSPGRWYQQLKPYSKYKNDDYIGFEGYHCTAKEDLLEEDIINFSDAMYGINQELSCQDNYGNTNVVYRKEWSWNSFNQVDTPSELVMFSESNGLTFKWRKIKPKPHIRQYSEYGPGQRALHEYGYPFEVRESGVDPVHNGKALYLHADGRVSSVSVYDWLDLGDNFEAHAEKYFHPKGDLTILPSGPPVGMKWSEKN